MTVTYARGADPASRAKLKAERAAALERASSDGTVKSSSKPANNAKPQVAFTQADIDKAVAKTRAEERARITTVFSAKASHGRERACAILLSADKAWSGAFIASELPHLASDKERQAADRAEAQAKTNAASDAVGDRAYAGTNSKAQQILANQRAVTGKGRR